MTQTTNTARELTEALEVTGALRTGHFTLSSGRHSAQYVQCALLLQYPKYAERFAKRLAEHFRALRPTCVVGPALGGITIAYEIARALDVRALFAERQGGAMMLRRGFSVNVDDRVVVVEDVITTGGSAREVALLIQQLGAHVVGIGSLIDRSEVPPPFPAPLTSLLKYPLETFSPAECPFCLKQVPIEKPGSRSA